MKMEVNGDSDIMDILLRKLNNRVAASSATAHKSNRVNIERDVDQIINKFLVTEFAKDKRPIIYARGFRPSVFFIKKFQVIRFLESRAEEVLELLDKSKTIKKYKMYPYLRAHLQHYIFDRNTIGDGDEKDNDDSLNVPTLKKPDIDVVYKEFCRYPFPFVFNSLPDNVLTHQEALLYQDGVINSFKKKISLGTSKDNLNKLNYAEKYEAQFENDMYKDLQKNEDLNFKDLCFSFYWKEKCCLTHYGDHQDIQILHRLCNKIYGDLPLFQLDKTSFEEKELYKGKLASSAFQESLVYIAKFLSLIGDKWVYNPKYKLANRVIVWLRDTKYLVDKGTKTKWSQVTFRKVKDKESYDYMQTLMLKAFINVLKNECPDLKDFIEQYKKNFSQIPRKLLLQARTNPLGNEKVHLMKKLIGCTSAIEQTILFGPCNKRWKDYQPTITNQLDFVSDWFKEYKDSFNKEELQKLNKFKNSINGSGRNYITCVANLQSTLRSKRNNLDYTRQINAFDKQVSVFILRIVGEFVLSIIYNRSKVQTRMTRETIKVTIKEEDYSKLSKADMSKYLVKYRVKLALVRNKLYQQKQYMFADELVILYAVILTADKLTTTIPMMKQSSSYVQKKGGGYMFSPSYSVFNISMATRDIKIMWNALTGLTVHVDDAKSEESKSELNYSSDPGLEINDLRNKDIKNMDFKKFTVNILDKLNKAAFTGKNKLYDKNVAFKSIKTFCNKNNIKFTDSVFVNKFAKQTSSYIQRIFFRI